METNTPHPAPIRINDVMYGAVLILLLLAGIFFMARPQLGVVDIEHVLHETGMMELIQAESSRLELEANADLALLQTGFEVVQQELAEELKQAEGEDLEQIRRKISRESRIFQEEAHAIRNRMQQQRRQVMKQVRERLQPIIVEAARRRKRILVMERGAGIMYLHSRANITDSVLQRALDQREELTAPLDLSETAPLTVKP